MKIITESINKGFENKYGSLEMGYKNSKYIVESREDDDRISIREAEIRGRLDFLNTKSKQHKLTPSDHMRILDKISRILDIEIKNLELDRK